MSPPTKVRQHEWVEFRMSSVKLVLIDDDEPHFIPDPLSDPEVTYGCRVCDMGFNEAQGTACPGQDLFEENHGN